MSSIVIPESGWATIVSMLISGNLAIAIGRGEETWDADLPVPSPTSEALHDPIGVARARYQHFVKPLDNGSIEASDGTRWEISETPTRYLYVTVVLDYDDAADETIREYALYLNPKFESAVAPGQEYVPLNQVTDIGQLIGIKNIHPINRVVSRQTIGEIIDL